ncbi:MAG: hypothetical protein ACK5RL_03920 [Acidimicrobiales bacterium]
MTAEVLDALIWRARAALRVDGLSMHVGHGLADPLYRPPRLPYASVLGPLSYALEPERDLPRNHVLTVLTPGYLAGDSLPDTHPLPPPGPLTLLIDRDVRVTLAVDHGGDQGNALTAERGVALAERLQEAFHAALAAGPVAVDGTQVDDQQRIDELRATTIRWDDSNRRLVMASGRRGPLTGDTLGVVSSVELDPAGPFDQAAGLGLAAPDPLTPAAVPPGSGPIAPRGRIVRHQVPSPVAMSFDMRVDLWAGSQRHLAAFVEAWARVTPTRCQLLLRPALLGDDVPAGSTALHLAPRGESPTRWTLAQLEPIAGAFTDRQSSRDVTATGGVTVDADGLRIPADGQATIGLLPRPAIPDPFAPAHPAPTGWALACRVSTDDGIPAGGGRATLVAIEHDGRTALALSLVWMSLGNGNGFQPTVEVTGQTSDGIALPPARLPVDAAALAAGIEVHGLVDAIQGALAVFADGEAMAGDGLGPLGVPGGDDMILRLGGGPAPAARVVGHVQVMTRPLGPVDHRHRATLATSDRWRPGDPVTLVRSDDGFSPTGPAFVATVVGVSGTGLELDRPVVGDWSRSVTLVGTRVVFSHQTQVRRRDDLASHLARLSSSHTVSAYIDPTDAGTSARLVEAIDLQIRDRSLVSVDGADPTGPTDRMTPPRSRRRHGGAPGIEAPIVPARVMRTHHPTGDAPTGADQIERVPQAPAVHPIEPIDPG